MSWNPFKIKQLFHKKAKNTRMVHRAPRIFNDGVKFTFQLNDKGVIIDAGILNISIGGLGVRFVGVSPKLEIGSRYRSEISINNEKFNQQLECRFCDGGRGGFRFGIPNMTFFKALRRNFDVDFVAASLAPVRRDYLDHSRGIPTWYTDGSGNELYFLKDPKAPDEFLEVNFVLSGVVFSWDLKDKSRIGYELSSFEFGLPDSSETQPKVSWQEWSEMLPQRDHLLDVLNKLSHLEDVERKGLKAKLMPA